MDRKFEPILAIGATVKIQSASGDIAVAIIGITIGRDGYTTYEYEVIGTKLIGKFDGGVGYIPVVDTAYWMLAR